MGVGSQWGAVVAGGCGGGASRRRGAGQLSLFNRKPWQYGYVSTPRSALSSEWRHGQRGERLGWVRRVREAG